MCARATNLAVLHALFELHPCGDLHTDPHQHATGQPRQRQAGPTAARGPPQHQRRTRSRTSSRTSCGRGLPSSSSSPAPRSHRPRQTVRPSADQHFTPHGGEPRHRLARSYRAQTHRVRPRVARPPPPPHSSPPSSPPSSAASLHLYHHPGPIAVKLQQFVTRYRACGRR
jgi:hypothetical protein